MNHSSIVNANGRVISEKPRKDGKVVLTLLVKKEKDAGRNTYARFICDPSIIPEHRLRAHLKISGHLNRTFTHVGDNKLNSQEFIADTIEIDKTLTDKYFGVHGKFYAAENIEIALCGSIRNIREDNGWIRLLIDVSNTDETNSIPISMRKPDRMPNIDKDKEVAVVATLSSPKKNIGGKDVYFENLIAIDIAMV